MSLGVYPAISLQEARERAAEYRKLLKGNINPGARRRGDKQQRHAGLNTFRRGRFARRLLSSVLYLSPIPRVLTGRILSTSPSTGISKRSLMPAHRAAVASSSRVTGQ